MAAGDVGAARANVAQAAPARPPVDLSTVTTTQQVAEQPRQEVSAEQERAKLRQAADDFNSAFAAFNVQAHFSVHEGTNQIVVDLVDGRTGDVIREIPPKELLDRYVQMMDILGIFVDKKA
jgi:flagellar protein FlaG